MEILIAGGKGHIGSYLYSKLEKHNNVSTIDYDKDLVKQDFNNFDLNDIEKVNHFTSNCDHFDVIIFLVGLAHAKGKGKDLPEFKRLNYQTLVNLLTALEKNNKIPEKIIFASTISVYGEKYHQITYDEEIVPEPFSPYAVTKLEAEKYLRKNIQDRSWILRFAPVYSSDFFLNVNRRTMVGSRFYRTGKGLCKLSLCNIENITSAVEGIINGKVPAGVYNLSDAVEYTYVELLASRNATRIICVPLFVLRILYLFGKLFNNTFLKENTVKLISDNVFTSKKICSYIELKATINDIKKI